jgi:hypothetical protein
LLLDLFRDSDQIRLVTTNLDTHFTTAARDMGAEPDFYYAPALPLGHRFTGVVYLHGCVGKDESNFVLTDADFGRAYLTEGWATRFLQGVFQGYSVLFIGYSHDDTVMTYLARGLPPHAKARFVLTSQTHKDHWSLIKTGVLSYSSENNHIALTVGMRGWVELCCMGALEHERRVQSILSLPPPPAGEEADYISRVVDDPATVHFFTRYANSLDWLLWVEGHRVFRHLFSNEKSNSDDEVEGSARHLARWFASNFVVKYVDEALALVRRQGRQLSPPLWDEVAAALARDASRPPGVLARWAAILFPPPSFEQQSSLLEDLLKSCRVSEDNSVALFIFDYLTHMRLKLRDSRGFEEYPCAEIELMGVPANLRFAWRQVFLPRFDELAMQLAPVVTNRLRQAYLLLSSAANPAQGSACADVSHRSIQVGVEESGLGAGVDFLTDAARELIGWLAEHDPSRARRVIADWSDSGVPVLEQIASQQ